MNKMLPVIVIVLLVALGAGFLIMSRNTAVTQDTVSPQTGTDTGTTMEVPVPGTETSEMEVAPEGSEESLMEGKKTFTIEGSNFKFVPATMTVKKGDTVEIVFNNAGDMPHDFVIDEFNVKTQQITEGQTETVSFVADQAGTFEYYCSVGQHRANGMFGTLTVTE